MPKKKGPVELPPVNEGVWFAGGSATVSADDEGTAQPLPAVAATLPAAWLPRAVAGHVDACWEPW